MASRKDEKERLRAERMRREQEAATAERRKRLVGYGAGGVLAVAAIAAVIVAIAAGGGEESAPGADGEFPDGSVPAAQVQDLEQAADAAGCRLQDFQSEGNNHVEGEVDYEANPPTSGDHFAIPAEDGAYTEAPETEALVHSLEHGRIIIQFDPALPDSAKGDLKALYDELAYHSILTPNDTGMPYEVAATAWTHSLGCPRMNERVFDAIRAFYQEYVDQGPEFVS